MNVQTRSHRYDEIGFPGVTLEDVKVETCNQCGHVAPVIGSVTALHRRIAMAMVLDPRRLAPTEFRFLRTMVDLDVIGLSRVMGLKPKTVERWEAGVDPIGKLGERLLRTLVFCEHWDAGPLFGLVREMEAKDLQTILVVLKPAEGPRVLRLKCKEVTRRSWSLSREPEKPATPSVRLVQPVSKAQ